MEEFEHVCMALTILVFSELTSVTVFMFKPQNVVSSTDWYSIISLTLALSQARRDGGLDCEILSDCTLIRNVQSNGKWFEVKMWFSWTTENVTAHELKSALVRM